MAGFDIPNGSFEIGGPGPGNEWSVSEASVPGWKTTAPDHMIELWGRASTACRPMRARYSPSSMPTDVAADYNTVIVPKGQPSYRFAHRGREGVDTS